MFFNVLMALMLLSVKALFSSVCIFSNTQGRRLTLSSPQLVPSTAPSSFEWQVVPTVHHRVLHTFWGGEQNAQAWFSNQTLDVRGQQKVGFSSAGAAVLFLILTLLDFWGQPNPQTSDIMAG